MSGPSLSGQLARELLTKFPSRPTRGMDLKTHTCTISAHCHRTSVHVEPHLGGVPVTSWSVGCLCDLHPIYSPLNRWNHGFAVIANPNAHDWQVTNYKFVEGKIMS